MISTTDELFLTKIDNWVYNALKHDTESFEQLLTSLPSIYPPLVLSSLRRLVEQKVVSKKILLNLSQNVKYKKQQECQEHHDVKLPIPHPLDYDWRFSNESIELLLNKFQIISSYDDPIILLGTPSILRFALESKYPRQMILLDANNIMIENLSNSFSGASVLRCNLVRDQLPEISSSVVVIDPPWYEEYMRLFLWAACQVCTIGGHILVSTPPVGTRPSIEVEWENILKWTQDIGLTLIQVESNILPYISPPFERNALKTEGLCNVPSKWRRGNLATFFHTHYVPTPRPKVSPYEEKWIEEVLSGIRLRIRDDNNQDFRDPSLISFISDNILSSVSRRDNRRKLVDVWTSNNRVFKCEGKFTLQQIMHALANNASPYKALANIFTRQLSDHEVKLVSHAIDQVNHIINLEQNELLLFGDEL